MSTHDRPARVAHDVQREISGLITRGLKDPRIGGFITVTGAKMSPDLRDCTVYVSVHADEHTRQQTMAGLAAAAGFLKREVARNLKLRLVPNLRFSYDESIEEGDKIDRLLREVSEKEGWKK